MHQSYNPDYFKNLFQLEAGNFWFRSRNRLLIWSMDNFFPNANSFLEIGCGTGFVLSGLHKHYPYINLAGSEIFAEGLEFAKQRTPNVKLFQMDARKTPFEDEYDVIGAFDVIEHIEEDELVLSQMYKAVKLGGGIMITVPQHRWIWSPVDEYAHHKRRYTRSMLSSKVKNSGFTVVYQTSFVTLLLPLMILSRFKQRFSSSYETMDEFRISRFANMIFERIMDLERWFIKAGLSMPVGGSLLMIAKKCR